MKQRWRQYALLLAAIILLPAGILIIFKFLYNPRNAYLSAYSSILFDYLQLTAILSLSFGNFDTLGQFWLHVTRWLTLLSLQETSQLPFIFNQKYAVLLKQLAFLVILPLLNLALLFLYFWLLRNSKCQLFKEGQKSYRALVLIYWLYMLPFFSSLSFHSFRCTSRHQITANSEISQECWQFEHFVAIIGGLIGLLIHSAGLIFYLRHLRKRHFKEECEHSFRIFGFIFRKYNLSKQFWEKIKVIEKLVLVAVAVFYNNRQYPGRNNFLQVPISLVLVLQATASPYARRLHNRLNIMCYVTVYSTLVLELIINDPETEHHNFTWIITPLAIVEMLGNLAFLVVFLFYY